MKLLMTFFAVTMTIVSAIAQTTVTYIKPDTTGMISMFGRAVSISGDVLVIGAPFESQYSPAPGPAITYSGAVYVYVRSGTSWRFHARLTAAAPRDNDRFGYSVSVSGDTIIVGAPGDSNRFTESGAAYIFIRSGETWVQQAYLKAHNPGVSYLFGWSVGISGDTVVVGAPHESSSARGVNGQGNNDNHRSGAAYIFRRSGSTWIYRYYLKANNNQFGGAQFGASVAIDGSRLVIGAPVESSDSSGEVNPDNPAVMGSGSVHVFEADVFGVWSEKALLKATPLGAGDTFGAAVALSGTRVVVGAPLEDSSVSGGPTDNSAQESGAIYVFDKTGDQFLQTGFLKTPLSAEWGYFGRAVAISQDLILAGDERDDSRAASGDGGATKSGAAHVFMRAGGIWKHSRTLKAPNADPEDRFGSAVAVSGSSAVVGAPFEDSAAKFVNGDQYSNAMPGSGAAYVFEPGAGEQQIHLSFTPVSGKISIIGPGCSLNGSYPTPVSFTYTPGQPCRIQAPYSIQAESGVRFNFVAWADGFGNPERDLAVTHPSALRASYERHVRLTLSVNEVGYGTVSPKQPMYVKEGSVVQVTAAPSNCRAFAGWTGGTVIDSAITLTHPANLTAHFGPIRGTISVGSPTPVTGSQNRYRQALTATNNSPFSADVSIILETPRPGAVIVNPVTPNGQTTSCTGVAGRAYYTFPRVPSGASATLTLEVTAPIQASARIAATAVVGPGPR